MDPAPTAAKNPARPFFWGNFGTSQTWNALQLQVLNVEVTQHLIGSEFLPSAKIRAVLVQWE